MNTDLTIKITEIMVRQKDSLTHTKFMLLPGGKTFPEDNFNLAKEWMEQGLLSDRAAYRIKRIIEMTA